MWRFASYLQRLDLAIAAYSVDCLALMQSLLLLLELQ
jgi:hypothetical protein